MTPDAPHDPASGMPPVNVVTRLHDGPPLLLDGGLGSELDRRGVDTSMPLWSARALWENLDTLRAVHREYAEAGADIVVTNTFRTQQRTLDKAGVKHREAELVALATEVARQAISEAASSALVAGSVSPLEDCYHPELVPSDGELGREHEFTVAAMAVAGVDMFLVETMNTAREAVAAARAAVATGIPVLVGLVCDAEGMMLSGEDPGTTAATLADIGVDGVLINCAPAPTLISALQRIRSNTELPTGGYGNVGHADDEGGWVNTDAVDPEAYCRYADAWLEAGARVVGSCCGTTPAHTRALRRLVDARQSG